MSVVRVCRVIDVSVVRVCRVIDVSVVWILLHIRPAHCPAYRLWLMLRMSMTFVMLSLTTCNS